MKFETLAIHAGQEPDPNNGAVMTPIYQTSTYAQDGIGRPRQGYEYSRTLNPTRKALQDCLAELEGGAWGLAFSSGMAATDTVLRLLASGDHVAAGNDVYGGTFRLFDKVLRRFGLDFAFADTTDPENLAEALTASTRIVWLETPTNPLLAVSDIRAVAEVVKSHPNKPLLVVDLFEVQVSKRAMICLLLAMLEMAKSQALLIVHDDDPDKVGVKRNSGFESFAATQAALGNLEDDYH